MTMTETKKQANPYREGGRRLQAAPEERFGNHSRVEVLNFSRCFRLRPLQRTLSKKSRWNRAYPHPWRIVRYGCFYLFIGGK